MKTASVVPKLGVVIVPLSGAQLSGSVAAFEEVAMSRVSGSQVESRIVGVCMLLLLIFVCSNSGRLKYEALGWEILVNMQVFDPFRYLGTHYKM